MIAFIIDGIRMPQAVLGALSSVRAPDLPRWPIKFRDATENLTFIFVL